MEARGLDIFEVANDGAVIVDENVSISQIGLGQMELNILAGRDFSYTTENGVEQKGSGIDMLRRCPHIVKMLNGAMENGGEDGVQVAMDVLAFGDPGFKLVISLETRRRSEELKNNFQVEQEGKKIRWRSTTP